MHGGDIRYLCWRGDNCLIEWWKGIADLRIQDWRRIPGGLGGVVQLCSQRGPDGRRDTVAVKRRAGFTLIEMMVVLSILGITLVVVATTFSRYLDRSSAKRSAEIFGQDLTAARNMATRSRQTVVMDFNEGTRSYLVRVEAGDTILYRFFNDDSDITLSSLDLQLVGDSVAFDSRGFADLSGATGSLGWALFVARGTTYAVRFNSMGSSRIAEQ